MLTPLEQTEHKTTQSPALDLWNQYIKAYESRQWDVMKNLFVSQNANGFGTGKDEQLKGLDDMKRQHTRDWSQSKSARIELKEILHQTERYVATTWKAHIILQDGKSYVWDNMRGTVIVEQEKGQWKIAHFHASEPSANQEDGQSFITEGH